MEEKLISELNETTSVNSSDYLVIDDGDSTNRITVNNLFTGVDAISGVKTFISSIIIPGPYANDTEASTAGIVINAIYRKSDGTVAWRQS